MGYVRMVSGCLNRPNIKTVSARLERHWRPEREIVYKYQSVLDNQAFWHRVYYYVSKSGRYQMIIETTRHGLIKYIDFYDSDGQKEGGAE